MIATDFIPTVNQVRGKLISAVCLLIVAAMVFHVANSPDSSKKELAAHPTIEKVVTNKRGTVKQGKNTDGETTHRPI